MEEFIFDNTHEDEDLMHGKYLTFSVGEEFYGLEIVCVTEIVGIQSMTKVPYMPDYVKGIINLRGKIIPIIDMRLRFRKKPIPYDDRTCIVVLEVDGMSLGLIVDTVLEVCDIPDDQVAAPPDAIKGKNRYIRGIGKTQSGVRLLLDTAAILSDNKEDVARSDEE